MHIMSCACSPPLTKVEQRARASLACKGGGRGEQPGAKVYSGCTTEARQPRQPDVWGPLTSLDGVRVLVETLSSLVWPAQRGGS